MTSLKLKLFFKYHDFFFYFYKYLFVLNSFSKPSINCMQIQVLNYDDGLSMWMLILSFGSFTLILILFNALGWIKDHYGQIKRNTSCEDLNEFEKSRWCETRKNTKINSKTVIIDSALIPKKPKVKKSVMIQEEVNKYHYINVKSEPTLK